MSDDKTEKEIFLGKHMEKEHQKDQNQDG